MRTIVSGISAGSELLVYRGEVSPDQPADATIAALSDSLSFPLRYGYAAVGEVTAVGEAVSEEWLGRVVFAFHPHASHFVTTLDGLLPVPEGIPCDTTALLSSAETAVNLVLDGGPLVGERVAVFGQGVVGLLTTTLLARFPLERLVTVDGHERRRDLSERFGADESLDPVSGEVASALRRRFGDAGRDDNHAHRGDADPGVDEPGGADLVFEISGSPVALDDAIDAAGYGGRVVVGSWYGTKPASLNMDTRFHRNRIRLVGSQVSTIDPALRGRWTRGRRRQTAWRLVAELDAAAIVTHRYPVERAPEAYALLDDRPQDAVQVLLTYDHRRDHRPDG